MKLSEPQPAESRMIINWLTQIRNLKLSEISIDLAENIIKAIISFWRSCLLST